MRFDAADLQRIFAEILGELSSRFEEAAIPYMIVGGVAVGPVVSVEDLIIFKLIAGRPQDMVDVYNLLRDHAGALDQDYLNQSAEEWELRDSLDRARASAGS